ncbi:MAG: hypothetical protein SGILL_010112 [Bacillariaceae sp.]
MPLSRPEQRIPSGDYSTDDSVATPEHVPSSSRKSEKSTTATAPLKSSDEYMEIENKNEIPMWLAPCHFVTAIFQFMQALFIFAFSTKVDLKWCVYTFYPNAENEVHENDIYAIPEENEVGCFTITWYAGVAILLSGLHHLSNVLPRFREAYEYKIARHQSPARWIEYSLSCAIMRVHIAQVAGVTDLYTLILTFFLSHAGLLFAMSYEKLNCKNRADGYVQDQSPFWFGVVCHIASWAIIFAYFIVGMSRIDASLAIGLVLALFFLEMTFPIVFVLQWGKIGPFEDYLIGELAFCLLSFTTKTFLAWATLIGANAYARRG